MSDSFDHQRERQSLLEESDRLHALVDDWEDEMSEDEEALLIDLEKAQSSHHTGDGGSTYSSFAESGSVRTTKASLEGEEVNEGPGGDLQLAGASGASTISGPEQALALNRALQGIIEGYVERISQALEENKETQIEIDDEMKADQPKKQKGASNGPFRSPYFRTDTSYPPANKDTMKKRATDEPMSGHVKEHVAWKKSSREILREAVFHNLREQALAPVMNRHDNEVQKMKQLEAEVTDLDEKVVKEKAWLERLNKLGNDSQRDKDDREEYNRNINTFSMEKKDKKKQLAESTKKSEGFKKELKKIGLVTEETVLANVDTEKVDWMKISKSRFGQNTSWLDCKKAWEHEVTRWNTAAPWTDEELEKLNTLVTKLGMHKWEEVAERIGGSHTPFQCLSTYQVRLNSYTRSRPWTSEEDKKLVDNASRIQDSFGMLSWKRVASLLDARSPTECMLRYSKVDPGQRHGRWTDTEDVKLIAAVEMMGSKWAKVAKFMGTRNMFQCRDRYVNCLDTKLNYSYFSYNEDVKLLRLYKDMGNKWSAMVPYFKGRTDAMLMNRIKTLNKWKEQLRWFDSQTQDMKDLMCGKFLPKSERKAEEEKVKAIMARDMGIWFEDYRRIKDDQSRGIDAYLIPSRPPFHLKLSKGVKHLNGASQSNAWVRRLNMTQMLLNNLKLRIKAETDKANTDTEEGLDNDDAQDISQDVTGKSEKERQTQMTSKRPLTTNIFEVQQTLNRMFLGDHTISVQDLINQAVQGPKLKPPKQWDQVSDNTRIMNQLRRVLRRRSFASLRKGRNRKLVRPDERSKKDIRAELEKLETAVPSMLVKSLGSDLNTLHKKVLIGKLNAEEEFTTAKFSDTDPKYLEQVQHLANEVERLRVARENNKIGEEDYQKNLDIVERRRKGAQNVIRRLYNSKKLQAEANIKLLADHEQYAEELLGLKLPKKKRVYIGLAEDNEEINELDKAEAVEALLKLSNRNKEATETEIPMEQSDNKKSDAGDKPTEDDIDDNDDEKEKEWDEVQSHINKVVDGGDGVIKKVMKKVQKNHEKDSKRASSRAASAAANERMDAIKQWHKRAPKQPKPLPICTKSLEDIMAEQAEIKIKDKKFMNSLPYFPPCTTTMTALKTLLMVKTSIQLKASQLLLAAQDRKAKTAKEATLHVISDPHHEIDEKSVTANKEPEDVLDSKQDTEDKLMVPSDNQQLTQQAMKFSGFKSKWNRDPAEIGIYPSAYTQRRNQKFRADDKILHTGETDIGSISSFSKLPPGATPILKIDPKFIEPIKSQAKILRRNVQSEYEVVMDVNKKCQPSILKDQQDIETARNENEQRFTYLKADRDAKKSRTVSSSGDPPQPGPSSQEADGVEIVEHHSHKTNSISLNAPHDGSNVSASTSSLKPTPAKNSSASVGRATPRKVTFKDEALSESDESVIKFAAIATRGPVYPAYSKAPPEPLGIAACTEANQVLEITEPWKSITPADIPILSRMNYRRLQNVVIAGLDKTGKHVVHFKSQNNNARNFMAYEEKLLTTVEEGDPRNDHKPKQLTERDIWERKIATGDYLDEVRQMPEYKLMFARFKALFMWPGLLSTVVPPVRTRINVAPTVEDTGPKKSFWKRTHCGGDLGKLSKGKKETVKKAILQRWANVRSKKAQETQQEGETEEGTGGAEGGTEGRTEGGTERETEGETPVVERGPAGGQLKSLSRARRRKLKRTLTKPTSEPKRKNKKRFVAPPEGERRRSGRKRPWNEAMEALRAREELEAEQVAGKSGTEQDNTLPQAPQWWKDAMLAVMLSKKAMAEDGEEDIETPIADDPDFQDRGNYSDDDFEQGEGGEGLSGLPQRRIPLKKKRKTKDSSRNSEK